MTGTETHRTQLGTQGRRGRREAAGDGGHSWGCNLGTWAGTQGRAWGQGTRSGGHEDRKDAGNGSTWSHPPPGGHMVPSSPMTESRGSPWARASARSGELCPGVTFTAPAGTRDTLSPPQPPSPPPNITYCHPATATSATPRPSTRTCVCVPRPVAPPKRNWLLLQTGTLTPRPVSVPSILVPVPHPTPVPVPLVVPIPCPPCLLQVPVLSLYWSQYRCHG